MDKLSLLFVGGKTEAYKIVNCVDNRNNFQLQEETFDFYLDKLYFCIDDYKNAIETLGTTYDFTPLPSANKAFKIIQDFLEEDFRNTRCVDFSLFCLGYYIVENYTSQIRKNWVEADPEFLAKKIIKMNTFYSLKNYKDTAKVIFDRCVPFFGKMCVYGIKTLFDLLLVNDLYPVGFGINCFKAHGGMYDDSWYDIPYHDIGHLDIINIAFGVYGVKYFKDMYAAILREPIENQSYLLYALFLMLHEQNYSDGEYDFTIYYAEMIEICLREMYDIYITMDSKDFLKFLRINFKFDADSCQDMQVIDILHDDMCCLSYELTYELYQLRKGFPPAKSDDLFVYFDEAYKIIHACDVKKYRKITDINYSVITSIERLLDPGFQYFRNNNMQVVIYNFCKIMSTKLKDFIHKNNLQLDRYKNIPKYTVF